MCAQMQLYRGEIKGKKRTAVVGVASYNLVNSLLNYFVDNCYHLALNIGN